MLKNSTKKLKNKNKFFIHIRNFLKEESGVTIIDTGVAILILTSIAVMFIPIFSFLNQQARATTTSNNIANVISNFKTITPSEAQNLIQFLESTVNTTKIKVSGYFKGNKNNIPKHLSQKTKREIANLDIDNAEGYYLDWSISKSKNGNFAITREQKVSSSSLNKKILEALKKSKDILKNDSNRDTWAVYAISVEIEYKSTVLKQQINKKYTTVHFPRNALHVVLTK